jgi:[methyl-Co(III) methanol-specific corrinoid protein]:coenzyme M methyltransferase
MSNPRDAILSLLHGECLPSPPAFSGLIHVTAEGLESEGLAFHEVHRDAEKMARAAASTFRLTGLPSAVAPLDMLVEAEALGAEIDFRKNGEYEFPRAARFLFSSSKDVATEFTESTGILKRGRIKVVCEAIAQLERGVGNEAVIGGLIPGPYTLLLFLVEPAALFTEMKRDPQVVSKALRSLSRLLAQVGGAYREAGADFITIHDMGGSPGFIGPIKYEQFVFPAEKQLMEALPKPRVLSVCGNTNKSMNLLAQTGADAISVDQTNDLAASRTALAGKMLFGNIDPVATLWQGDYAKVREAISQAKEVGVDGIWPGCDLVPQTPPANLRALVG